jgi:hypothetical protein
MVLISEYSMRVEEHTLSFITWGCAYQIMRLLSLDSAQRPNSPNTPRESTVTEIERRLLWSCFILDSFIGSGIDGNLRWRDEAPRIPLPCSDHSFLEQTQSLAQERLPSEAFNSSSILAKLDLRTQVIYLAYLRTQALRLISIRAPFLFF